MYSPINEDVERQAGYGGGSGKLTEPTSAFAEAIVRRGFVRKVLGILLVQLAVTAASATTFMAVPSARLFVAANPWVLWTALVLSFALILVLACSEAARRSHPTNLILLFSFTACQALLIGTVCAQYNAQVVLIALTLTSAVVAGLVLFSFQTKTDVTSIGGVLYTLVFVLIAAGLLQIFIHAPWLHMLLCAGGAALFSVYLIFDLQLIMGNRKLALSPDEYVLAALNLYLDIINIFLYILQLVAELNKESE